MLLRFVLLVIFSISGVLSVASQSFEIYRQGKKEGLKADDQIVIPATYDQIGWSSDSEVPFGKLIGYQIGNKWGLVSTQKKVVTPPTYYRLEPFDEQYIKASIKGSFSNLLFNGLIDKQGKVVLSCNYFDIESINTAFVLSSYRSGKVLKGLYDTDFKQIAPIQFEEIRALSEVSYACRRPDGKWIFFSLNDSQPSSLFDDYRLEGDRMIVKSKGQFGLMGIRDLKLITPVSYKSAMDDEHLIPFPIWQVFELNLETVGQFNADSISIVGEVFISNINGNQQVLIDGKQLFEDQEIELKYASNGYLIIKQVFDQKWKLLSTSGNVIIEHQDSIRFDGTYFSALQEDHWSVYNRFGRKLSIKTFEEVGDPVSNLLPVKRLGYWTLMDFQGKLLTNPRYDEILGGDNNRIVVNYLGSLGVIDSYGAWVLRPSFEEVKVLEEAILAKKKGRYFVFGLDGVQRFSIPCDELRIDSGLIAIRQGENWGMLNRSGEYLADPIYREVGQVGTFLYGKGEGYVSLFYADGSQVANANHGIQDISDEKENLYRVTIDDRIGYVDAEARLRIANRYDDGGLLSEDRLSVKLLGRWGYVNAAEELVIQPIYEAAMSFDQGVAVVKKAGNYGLIGTDGQEILQCEFEKIMHQPGRGYIFKSSEGSWGAANAKGETILTPNYQMIKEATNGLLMVNRSGKWGIIDQDGFARVPYDYEEIYQYQDYFLMRKSAEP